MDAVTPEQPPAAFLQALATKGLSLTFNEESLLLYGPKAARTDAIRSYLRTYKPALITHLRKKTEEAGEPDQETEAYNTMVQQAVIAARAGTMPSGERVQIAPGTSTTEPARVLLNAVQRGQSLRSQLGEGWRKNIDGRIAASTIEDISLWWHERQF